MTYLGTKGSQTTSPGVRAALDEGFLMEAGISTAELANAAAPYSLGPGVFGFFTKDGWLSVDEAAIEGNNCCPLVLASAAIKTNDKEGPFHGGYTESNKSKFIDPRKITDFYRVDSCLPQQMIIHIGNTNYTSTLSPVNSSCCFEFYCDETYYLSLEVKGSPALRFANHNLYQRFDANGGCCSGPVPTVINSTLIMIQWANRIVESAYFKDFVKPIVYDEAGNPWFYLAADAVAAGYPATQIWSLYDTSIAHVDGECAGLRLIGAYVETKFGNCSFQVTDHYEVEPLKILASMTDMSGDVCTFEGICVVTECDGRQGMNFGESLLRNIILSESYRQNYFSTDPRIREITQGEAIRDAVDRNTLYTVYYIKHHVPRYQNAGGKSDTDQYLLEIITAAPSAGFESFMDAWLTACGDCVTMREEGCTSCSPVAV